MSLLTGAAAAGLVLAAAATAADAAPKHKAHEASAASAAEARQAEEIEQLKAQVESLSRRLLVTEQQQQMLQQQATQAQASAQAAQAQLANEIDRIPGAVDAQVAKALPKPKPSWADNTQVSGRMYADLTSLEQKSNGAKVPPSGVGFDIKRFYIGVDHRFSDVWSANVTTDMQYNSAESLTQVYVKKAYLQAKLSDAAVVRFGSADMAWIPFVEEVYGYRFVENTLIDRTKYGTSADWGVHVGGKLAGGLFNYAISIVDGQGYKNPVRTKTMDIEGRANINYDHFVLGVGGYSGKLGKNVQNGPQTFHAAERFDALAAYVHPKFRLGVEYFAANDWTAVTAALSDKADGYSLFGSYNLTPQVSAFGRYDSVKPFKDTRPSEKDNYFNIGLNWEPVKIVDLALVYKHDKAENGALSTSNGTLGGSRDGTYDEVGLFTQLRW
jgi:hypothetical protein